VRDAASRRLRTIATDKTFAGTHQARLPPLDRHARCSLVRRRRDIARLGMLDFLPESGTRTGSPATDRRRRGSDIA